MSAPKSDEAGIRQTIRALRSAGFFLDRVYDGEEDVTVNNEQDAVEAITAVDEAYLWVVRAGEDGWVRFVMGNDPEEVVCDHTINLGTVLDPLMEGWWK